MWYTRLAAPRRGALWRDSYRASASGTPWIGGGRHPRPQPAIYALAPVAVLTDMCINTEPYSCTVHVLDLLLEYNSMALRCYATVDRYDRYPYMYLESIGMSVTASCVGACARFRGIRRTGCAGCAGSSSILDAESEGTYSSCSMS
eukprot:COSAG01_NODE_3673_length_5808_cov_15.591872_2_plen_146_part_00